MPQNNDLRPEIITKKEVFNGQEIETIYRKAKKTWIRQK